MCGSIGFIFNLVKCEEMTPQDPIQTYLSEVKERESKALCSKDLYKIRAMHLEAAASGDWKSITIDHLLGDLEPMRTDIPTLVAALEVAVAALENALPHVQYFASRSSGPEVEQALDKIRTIVEGARK